MQAPRAQLVQQQKLKLSPQMYQSIQIMALPLQDLRLRVAAELESNPALEATVTESEVSLDELEPRDSEERERFENSSDSGYDDEKSDANKQFIEGALAHSESLQDHLLWQLGLQKIDGRLHRVAELLIENLDQRGFHREPPESFIAPADRELIPLAADLVQQLDPIGCCVADYRESLLVQARSLEDGAMVEQIVAEHLDLAERNKVGELARRLQVDPETVEHALAALRQLNPFPGSLYSSSATDYIIPEVWIRPGEEGFLVQIQDDAVPQLVVNPLFDELARTRGRGNEDARFARDYTRAANWFIQALELRKRTLRKVAVAIVEFQRDFFRRGPKYLRPLTLRDVAEVIGVHEATVSRATAGKYADTEFGIFELKYFFTNSISGAGSQGSGMSKVAAKEILRELLQTPEAAGASDQQLSDMLKQRGISIARRTVNKYRKELDISSSYSR